METGLYYLRRRYYNPEIRRFISADDTNMLIKYQGNLDQYNLYSYCLNNPTNRLNIGGYWSVSAILKRIGRRSFLHIGDYCMRWLGANIARKLVWHFEHNF